MVWVADGLANAVATLRGGWPGQDRGHSDQIPIQLHQIPQPPDISECCKLLTEFEDALFFVESLWGSVPGHDAAESNFRCAQRQQRRFFHQAGCLTTKSLIPWIISLTCEASNFAYSAWAAWLRIPAQAVTCFCSSPP